MSGVLRSAVLPGTAAGPALPSLALPPLTAVPSPHPDPDILTTFVHRRTRGWGSVPVPLSPTVTAALWVLLVLNLAFSGWLVAVRGGAAVCAGILCTVATLGGHTVLTLVLTALCVGALLALVPSTRWLTCAGGPQIAVIVLASLSGVAALAGVAALLLFAALCLVVAFGVLVAVVARR